MKDQIEFAASKLPWETAEKLIKSVAPVSSDDMLLDIDLEHAGVVYTARTEELEISCSYSWSSCYGIRLLVTPLRGAGHISMFYRPDTLDRDFEAEMAETESTRQTDFRNWVWQVGREQAHRLVDRYCGDFEASWTSRSS